MSIAQRIADYRDPRIGGRCFTCNLIRNLPAEEAEALKRAMKDKRISNAGLASILKAEGYRLAESTIRRHRRGECRGEHQREGF